MAPASVIRGRAFVLCLLALAACSKSTTSGGSGMSSVAPKPDPRVGLKAGMWDAAQAAWNVKLVSTTPPSEKFAGVTNSDLAFTGKYAIQGSYNGWQVWDISDPAKPKVIAHIPHAENNIHHSAAFIVPALAATFAGADQLTPRSVDLVK